MKKVPGNKDMPCCEETAFILSAAPPDTRGTFTNVPDEVLDDLLPESD